MNGAGRIRAHRGGLAFALPAWVGLSLGPPPRVGFGFDPRTRVGLALGLPPRVGFALGPLPRVGFVYGPRTRVALALGPAPKIGLAVLTVLLAVLFSHPEGSLASEGSQEPSNQSVSLRCQIDGKAWQPCRMLIDSIGVHWWLVIGARRFEFHHDGHGNVTVVDGPGLSRSVTPQWRSTGILCWDGLCAEGPIPLD